MSTPILDSNSFNPLLDPHEDYSFFGSDLVENQGIIPSERIRVFTPPGVQPYVDLWSKITRVTIDYTSVTISHSVETGGTPYDYTITDTRTFVGEADREGTLTSSGVVTFRIGAFGLPWVGPALHPQRPSFGSTTYPFFYAIALGDHTIDIAVVGVQAPGPPIVDSTTTYSGNFNLNLKAAGFSPGDNPEADPPVPAEYVDTLGDITQAVWVMTGDFLFNGLEPKYLPWGDFDQGGVTIDHSNSTSETETSGTYTLTTTRTNTITIQLLTT